MKKVFSVGVLLIVGFVLQVASVYAVHVNGYYRSNGTYVQGYERTAPDSSPYNNYSYPGNYNPNTGSITGGSPSTYLNNYYNYSSPSYPTYSAPSTPTCPLMSSYNSLTGNCTCYSGYVVGTDYLGKEACVSALSKCSDLLGYGGTYDSQSASCKCRYGYLLSGSKCVSESSYCSGAIGLMSNYNSTTGKCECMTGYEYSGGSCVYGKKATCPSNSYLDSDNMCTCNSGYQVDSSKSSCVKSCSKNATLIGSQCACNDGYVMRNNLCISHTDNCRASFGDNAYGIKNVDGIVDNSSCLCNAGYEWNDGQTSCVAKKIIAQGESVGNINSSTSYLENERKAINGVDKDLSKKLKGRIVLQVEDKGQAWYINPKDEKKYYMADGNEAYNIMRNLGVGIKNNDLNDIKTNKEFAKKNSGKIFLQVESHGEAYYIDVNGNVHYLKDGNSAYNAMRNLGLGITNNDLRKIEIN